MERAGEFDEETNGGSSSAWECTKKHNEAVFHTIIRQMVKWDESCNITAA